MAKDASGKSLEKAVARIQQMLDPGSAVTHNERIANRLGIPRQFDVVIRGTAAGREYLGVIECKDWGDKVGTPEVDAFLTKARDVRANLVMMVSRSGFTDTAITQAKDAGIGTLSLIEESTEQEWTIGTRIYAAHYRWAEWKMELRYPVEDGPFGDWTLDTVLASGKPVLHWFQRELAKLHVKEEGTFPLEIEFREPKQLQVGETLRTILGISVTGSRICCKKSRFVRLSGDGYFDWQSQLAQIPNQGQIKTEGFSFDAEKWEDFEGDISEIISRPQTFLTLYFITTDSEIPGTMDAVDLSTF